MKPMASASWPMQAFGRLWSSWGWFSRPIQKDILSPRDPKTPGLNRFAVIGDTGMGDLGQYAIARQLTDTYEKTPFASVLVLGDNVYEYGEPHLFQERIYKPYKALFDKGVRFYPILGNHDVRRGYGARQLKYWNAPKEGYYKFSQGPIDFFALDTTVMTPGFEDCFNTAHERRKALKISRTQLKWLKRSLKNSKARFKIVYGHYPLYSSVDTREKFNALMRRILGPILTQKQYGVDVYLTGHDHMYERSVLPCGLQHIVSGAGSRLVNRPPKPTPFGIKRFLEHQFMLFTLDHTEKKLSFETLSKTGQLLDSHTLDKSEDKPEAKTVALRFGTATKLNRLA